MQIRVCFLIGIIWCCGQLSLPAQWDPSISQYMNNQMSFNPGYAGVPNTIYGNLNAKKQWMGVEGSPSTYQVSMHAPINKTYHAIGGSLFVYKMGPVQVSNASFVFSHLVKFNRTVYLSYGLSSGIINHSVRLNNIKVVNESDPLFQGESLNQLNLDVGAGAWLYGPDFYVGISMPHIIQTNFSEALALPAYKRHLYLTAGYDIKVEESLVIKPSLLFRATESMETLTDISAVFQYKTSLSLGLSYRMDESLVVLTNIWLNKNIGVGYAYDLGSENNGIGVPSHELSISYEGFKYFRKNKKRQFPKKKEEEKGIRSLRYF